MTLVEQLRNAGDNNSVSMISPLCRQAADEIDRLNTEVVKWKIEAGIYGAGCPACDDIGAENERLREALIRAEQQIHDVAAMPTNTDWIRTLVTIIGRGGSIEAAKP